MMMNTTDDLSGINCIIEKQVNVREGYKEKGSSPVIFLLLDDNVSSNALIAHVLSEIDNLTHVRILFTSITASEKTF